MSLQKDCKIEISIIIPHYNSPKSLLELLISIGECKNVEVIVVDDHSDHHLQDYEECKNQFSNRDNFIFLKNDPEKRGAGSARNVGLRRATGEWLLFADADDLFLDTMYERVIPFLKSNYDIVFFPPYISTNEAPRDVVQNYNTLCRAYHEGIEGVGTLLRYQFIVPWSKLIRRDLVEKYGIRFEEVMYSNDVMFSTKCGRYANQITVSTDPIYYSRSNKNSLVNQKNELSFFIRAEVNCEYFAFIRDNATEDQKNYLSSFALIRTYYRIWKNGYGLNGISKYSELLRKYELLPIQLKGFHKTYQIKKKLKTIAESIR